MNMSRGPRSSSLGPEARLGRTRSPVRFGPGGAVRPGEEKETMRGLNDRLADYLRQVRLLEEANSKLETQIQEVLTQRRAAGQRDWSGYEETLSTLRDQVKEMMMDNARLMLQIDNTKLAADDYKVKLDAEITIRQAVDQDIASLRKMIDDTHMSRMQLENEVESLTEELIYLKKSHEEDVAKVKGQIRDASVDVQMEAVKGDDLGKTIDKIRKQYEKAAQKSQEETESWYQAKFENVSAEVSRNTDALQQGQSELNDLRRQKQGMEIDVQTMHNMNHSLEDTLNDTLHQYSQKVNAHNMVIQQLEAELGEVLAQVTRQGAEYQALLNIKSKLEEEIATYHSLLEGTGVPSNGIADPGLPGNIDFTGMGEGDDVNVKNIGQPEDDNIGGNGLSGDDDRVEFSLEQALSAAPRYLIPELTPNNEIVEEEQIMQTDLELNAANTAMNKQYDQKEAGHGEEKDQVIVQEIAKFEETVNSVVEKKVVEKDMVCPGEDIVVEETITVSLMEKIQVEKVEEARSAQEDTEVEKVEEEGSPVVDETVSLQEGTRVEKVEDAVSPQEDTEVEKAVSHVVEAQVEEALSLVEEAVNLQEDTQVEESVSPVVDAQMEKAVSPEVDAKMEESVNPAEDTQVEEEVSVQDDTQPKEEVEPAVENIDADVEEEKQKGEEPENPEAEPLQNVEE